MINLNDLRVFAFVVEAGSFSRAAERLALPVSSVSAKVGRLEAATGLHLLERTTRRLRLTAAGDRLYTHARDALDLVARGAAAASSEQAEPVGLLRVTAPAPVARAILAPLVPRFLDRYARVRIDLSVTGRRVDLIEEGVDLAIRVGRVAQAGLVGRKLGVLTAGLFAAPRRLTETLAGDDPIEALRDLPLIQHGAATETARWTLTHLDGRTATLEFAPRLSSSDESVVLAGAEAGLGVACLPHITAGAAVASGRLRPVLPEWRVRSAEVWALFPSRLGATLGLRAFVAFLVENWSATTEDQP